MMFKKRKHNSHLRHSIKELDNKASTIEISDVTQNNLRDKLSEICALRRSKKKKKGLNLKLLLEFCKSDCLLFELPSVSGENINDRESLSCIGNNATKGITQSNLSSESSTFLAGIKEISLPAEYKIKNIEETEFQKKKLLNSYTSNYS